MEGLPTILEKDGRTFLCAACVQFPGYSNKLADSALDVFDLVLFSRAAQRVEGWHAGRNDRAEKQVDG